MSLTSQDESGLSRRDAPGLWWEHSGPSRPNNRKRARKARRARLHRYEKIQREVDAGIENWKENNSTDESAIEFRSTRALGGTHHDTSPASAEAFHSALPPPVRELDFKAGIFRSLVRLPTWLKGAGRFLLPMLLDKMAGRDPHVKGPRRLRETFVKMGVTFVKFGQQLSMRLDLIPYAYTKELADNLLDDVPAFPVAEAKAAISRATGCEVAELFSEFEETAIGSGSVACVYRARLCTGERVAVKVRRPGIGPQLAADMRAIGWLLRLVEIGFFTRGFFANFVSELRMMLMEELDFSREARFAELYRRKVRKTKQMRFVSVPKVFFELSNQEVMITEFATGIWLREVLDGLEMNTQAMTRTLHEMNCDRIILGRRIQLIARFNNFENIFFHADLHPANIMIQPGNKILLIDFGSCGSFNSRELNSWRRWYDAQSVDDVAGMVQAALAIIEPLPPIDRDSFGEQLEVKFWNVLYAIKSKHANWSERIASRLWYGFLELSRKHQIPMRLNTLRMIRASMLTDTIAIRLDPDQDSYREFRFYEKGAGKRAKRRVFKRVRRLAAPRSYIGVEHAIESTLKLVYLVQRAVESLATIRIQDIITKLNYLFVLFTKHVAWILGTLIAGMIYYRLSHWKDSFDVWDIFVKVVKSPVWIITVTAPYLIIIWRFKFRAQERKPWDN